MRAKHEPGVGDPTRNPATVGRKHWLGGLYFVGWAVGGPCSAVRRAGGRRQRSRGDGFQPTWSPKGGELFYQAPDRTIMVATYSVQRDLFNSDKPTRWSAAQVLIRPRGFISLTGRAFDVHPDGTRIAGAVAETAKGDSTPGHVVLILNFSEELKRLAPEKP